MFAQDLSQMYLTDDETIEVRPPGGPVLVRVRIWRAKGQVPFVLVEPAGTDCVRPHAARIATLIKHAVLKGGPMVYIEHEPCGVCKAPWNIVSFAQTRHHLVAPQRRKTSRADVEFHVGPID